MTDNVVSNEFYDSQRPWLRDEKDDPSKANWIAEFGFPNGKTRMPVFLRGQMMLAIARTALIIAVLIIAGNSPWLAAFVAFFGFTLLLAGSMIAHVRRLKDAGKPALLAAIIALPLLLGSVSGVLSAKAIPEAVAKAESLKAERSASATTETPAAPDATEIADDAKPKAKTEHQRRGPPSDVTEESMLKSTVSQSVLTFVLLSFLTAIFTFGYVARRPSTD